MNTNAAAVVGHRRTAALRLSCFIPLRCVTNKRRKLMHGLFEVTQRKPQRLGLNVCVSSGSKMLLNGTLLVASGAAVAGFL